MKQEQDKNDSLSRLINNLPGMAYQCKNDKDWTMTFVSEGAKELLGYDKADLIRNNKISFNELIYSHDRQGIWNFVQSALKKKETFELTYRIIDSKNQLKWVHEKGYGVFNQQGELTGLEGYISDVTEPVEVEEALKEQEIFLSLIIENIPNMVFIKDAKELRFIRINKAGELLLGLEAGEFIGKNDYDFFPREQADFFTGKDREVLQKREEADIPEEIIKTKNGERILHTKKIPITDDFGNPIYLLGISEDITEIKNSQKEQEGMKKRLALSQKMDSVGLLAGGIAHDFNNMLGVILGYTELCLDKTDQSFPLYKHLMEIHKAAIHSSELTKQLLAFSRQQNSTPEVLNINKTVEKMLKLLKRLIREDIELRWIPGDHIDPVEIDPVQINQILSNLCINARDAIDGCGTITIETSTIIPDDLIRKNNPDLIRESYTTIAVSDTGEGIDKEEIDNIFDPFFTTKEIGKGTGLGLSTVYGIVKQNGGYISAYSEKGHGTVFKIYLPSSPDSEIKDYSQVSSVTPGGEETILLVEDEPILLNMSKTMLENLGYHVLAANSSEEGIALARNNFKKIDLLITDVIMPKMNGKELVKEAEKIIPDLKSLYVSGYTSNILLSEENSDSNIFFLQKPFTLKDMGNKIREILDNS